METWEKPIKPQEKQCIKFSGSESITAVLPCGWGSCHLLQFHYLMSVAYQQSLLERLELVKMSVDHASSLNSIFFALLLLLNILLSESHSDSALFIHTCFEFREHPSHFYRMYLTASRLSPVVTGTGFSRSEWMDENDSNLRMQTDNNMCTVRLDCLHSRLFGSLVLWIVYYGHLSSCEYHRGSESNCLWI